MLAGSAVRSLFRKLRVLHEQGGRIDPHARHAPVEPEAQHVLVLGPHLGVRPVEIRLLRREEMEVPLAELAVRPRPRRAAEDRLPAVRRQVAAGPRAGPKPESRPLRRAGGRGERSAKPRVPVGDVVRDDVDDGADPELARLGDQLLRLLERAEDRVDRPVVGDVVAGVGERRRVPRVEPERVDPEVVQVRQAGTHAGEVADPVAVRVREAPHIDLVDDRVAPPVGHDRCGGSERRGVVRC